MTNLTAEAGAQGKRFNAEAVARRCIELVNEGEESWTERVRALLRKVLPENDSQLGQLVQRAQEEGGSEMVEELMWRLEQASTTSRLYLGGNPENASLVVVPLALFPGELSVGDALNAKRPGLDTASERIAFGLEQSGLMGTQTRAAGLPGIYTAHELFSLSFAEVGALLETGMEQLRTGKRGESKKKQPLTVSDKRANFSLAYSTPATANGRVVAEPAFLVLVLAGDSTTAAARPFFGESAQRDRSNRYVEWALDTAHVLEETIGAAMLLEVSGLPQAFHDGLRAGVEYTRDILLMSTVGTCSYLHHLDVEDIATRMACNEASPGVSVVLSRADSSEVLAGVELPVFAWETVEVACDAAESVLFELGVRWFFDNDDSETGVGSPRDSVQGG